MSSHCSPSSPSFPLPPLHRSLLRSKPKTLTFPSLRPPPIRAALSDPFVLEIAEKLEDSLSSSPFPPLQTLRDSSSQSLLSKPWPSSKDEPFRFTDTSFLKSSQILPVSTPNPSFPIPSDPNLITIVDGYFIPSLSRLSSLPSGVLAGRAADFPVDHKVFTLLNGFSDGDLFFDLNGVGTPDVTVVYVEAGVRVLDEPVFFRFCYSEGSEVGEGRLPVSSPRVLVLVEKGAEVVIVEEHLGVGGSEERCYWANSVMEIVIEEGGKVSHSYVQRQSPNAAHIKWTLTRQEASSKYELVEISTGARLSRHNLHIQQLGPDTVTELSAFHVSQSNQTQDLHSRLVLEHPRGYSRQLHKCIVSRSSGQVVFDGNIKVNRFAQQTDAGQLTRTLLLAPRATANLKPNLQIIADDVKCSHGAAVSDLEEDQLFYFQARGIDLQAARDALVFSFGAEVLSRIPFEPFRKSISCHVKELLAAQ